MSVQKVDETLGRIVIGFLGNDGRLGDHQAAQVVTPKRQLEVANAGFPDLFDGRAHAEMRHNCS